MSEQVKHVFVRHATGGPRWLVTRVEQPSFWGYNEEVYHCGRIDKKGNKYYDVFSKKELVFET